MAGALEFAATRFGIVIDLQRQQGGEGGEVLAEAIGP